ncbi:hypothetical protein DKM44_10700 [Deinococcus irradiatisoli]|uniref:Uncharacterized protein n=1 Tax=Deinococcus irradiatisoli TaxID=2202254 RepID=A0A2Z3JJ74_9DEIO|nr:hypothetical protein [Deinococcus irradiatisoli]AWN23641.1 hypothetical protein DKM44_10700 [Deinococcus irradiatisoli]
MTLAALRTLPDALLLGALKHFQPALGEEGAAAALALGAGVPDLALRWGLAAGPAGAALAAAAALRLGQTDTAQRLIGPLPPDARRAVLHARLQALRGEGAAEAAQLARHQARREGDAPALIAAVTLLGELQLGEAEALTALRTLAEGLKVAELTSQDADAHLLAVLAHAQRRVGGAAKARRTAEKALERAPRRSPARVWALVALERRQDAEREFQAGQLGAGWWPSGQ